MMEGVILMRLVEEFPDLLQRVDLFAGVSGGAIVASGLATGTRENRKIKQISCMYLSFIAL